MKRYARIASFVAAAMAVSCQPEQAPPPPAVRAGGGPEFVQYSAETDTPTATSLIMKKPLNSSTAGLTGFVDLHAHPMSHLGFGGKLIHGAPDVGSLMQAGTIWNGKGCNQSARPAANIAEALGTCYATHGGRDETRNTCGNDLRQTVIGNMETEIQPGPTCGQYNAGYPTFENWPKYNYVTHQQMYVDWIKRAYDGGQRVLVALALNNHTVARGIDGVPPYDDKASADLQIEELKKFVGRHKEWMEIADSSAALRRIVGRDDKLAIIIGAELDDIGSFNWESNRDVTVTYEKIRQEIRRLHSKGVHYIFPVHLIDNLFGGTAVYEDEFNFANRFHWGQWWHLTCADEQYKSYPPPTDVNYRFGWEWDFMRVLKQAVFPEIPVTETVPTPQCKGSIGVINSRPLQREGEVALREMMRLGMLIDIDHGSYRTVEDMLAVADSLNYPVCSGHNSLRSLRGDDKNEYNRTIGQYSMIRELGGMVGVGWAKGDENGFANDYRAIMPLMGYGGMALGTDINGLVAGPRVSGSVPFDQLYDDSFPQCVGPKIEPALLKGPQYDPKQVIPSEPKKWNVVTDEVAHYGLIPDYLRYIEIKLADKGEQVVTSLFHGAESFAVMWEKAETQSSSIPVDPWGRLGDACIDNGRCDSTFCDTGTGSGGTNRCVPQAGTGTTGQYCSQNAHCQSKRCSAQKCASAVGLGEPCPGGNSQCTTGYCDSGSGSGGTNKCVPKAGTGAVGQYCSQNAHCASQICSGGKCKAKADLGEPCPQGNTQCLSGYCDTGMGSGGTNRCVPKSGTGKTGDYCSQNGHCKPGHSCTSGACQ